MSYIAITADYNKLRKVRRRLRRKGYTAYLPAIVSRRPRVKGGAISRRRRIKPLMSYILVQTPEHPAVFDLWLYDVVTTKDVKGFVQFDGTAAFIPDASIQAVKEAVKGLRLELEAARHHRVLKRGAKAVIRGGTLAGKVGTVQWLQGRKAGIEAKLFGSMRVIVVARKDLEAA